MLTMLLMFCRFPDAGAQQSLDGFAPWITGKDNSTQQVIPVEGKNAVVIEDGKAIVHVKFVVSQYGEVSFPILPCKEGEEPHRVDLTKCAFITLQYQSNEPCVLQLRQTGVHGGVHNHIKLPSTNGIETRTIFFTSFKGGKSPLDLSDVSKFNFAFLSNNASDGFAELKVFTFKIDNYRP